VPAGQANCSPSGCGDKKKIGPGRSSESPWFAAKCESESVPPNLTPWFSVGWLAHFQVGREFLVQVEEFKNLGVLLTREGRMEQEIGRRIGAASAVIVPVCFGVE